MEGLARNERHHVVRDVVDNSRIVQRKDVRVLQCREYAYLAQKTLGYDAGRYIVVQNLDCNGPVVRQVARQEDRRHPAAAELPLDAIAAGKTGLQPLGDVRRCYESIVVVLASSRPPVMSLDIVRVVLVVEVNEVVIYVVIEIVVVIVVEIVFVFVEIILVAVVLFVVEVDIVVIQVVIIQIVEIVIQNLVFRIVTVSRTRCRVPITNRVPHPRVAGTCKTILRRLERVQHKISVLRG
jgi:hypothetical protein